MFQLPFKFCSKLLFKKDSENARMIFITFRVLSMYYEIKSNLFNSICTSKDNAVLKLIIN